jgi:hypothetical protein
MESNKKSKGEICVKKYITMKMNRTLISISAILLVFLPTQPAVPSAPVNPSVNPSVNPDKNNMVIVIPSNKILKPVEHRENLPVPPRIIFTKPDNHHTRDTYIKNHDITGVYK